MIRFRSMVPGSLAALLALTLSSTSPLLAQCSNPWVAVPGSTGVEGAVSDTLVFDPDGPGPLGERVLVAGDFKVAGTVVAENLAVYDPGTRTWAPFGAGPYPTGLSLGRANNGDIYVAGNFTSIAGVAALRVARWDGSNWSPLGSGLVGSYAPRVFVLPSGVVVTGNITAAGGVPTAGIAKWDGSSWSSLAATSLINPQFDVVVELPNGDLCATVLHSGTGFQGVARFDGTAWSELGPAFFSAPAALLALPSGELIAGGLATLGLEQVARWTGSTWAVLPGAPFHYVGGLKQLPNGMLAAWGQLSFSNDYGVATWDGLTWTLFGNASGTVVQLEALANGEMLAAGGFRAIDLVPALGLARWDGFSWSAASPGLVGSMQFLAVRPDGSIFAGAPNGAAGQGLVHRWNGLAWQAIGGGYWSGNGGGSNLTGLFALSNGDLLAGGQVGWHAGVADPILQRWSGTAWSTVATATWGTIAAAVKMANGDLVVGGQFVALEGVAANHVARFDGTNWYPMGSGVSDSVIHLAISPVGELFALSPSSVLRWDGMHWSQLGLSQGNTNTSLAFDAGGVPILGGNFPGADVLRWNGITWAPLGAGPGGPAQSVVVLPDGDVVAGPLVNANNPARELRRWDGAQWTAFGGPIDGTVYGLALALNGDLLLTGDFRIAGGEARCRFARVSTSCPAGVVSYSSGCYLAQATLTPNVLPWIGGKCRTTAASMPAGSLALIVLGASAVAVPLSSVVALPTYGCQLLVAPDLIGLAVPQAGVLHTEFAVPDSPTLLGVAVHQQVLSVLLDAAGAVSGMKATNALVLQIGSF